MHTRALIAVVVALAVIVPALAAASVDGGKYSGKTSEKKPFRFVVSRGKVKRLYFKWSAYCSSDASYVSGSYRPRHFSARISRRGAFRSTFKTSAGVKLMVKGRFHGHRASGKLHFVFDDGDCDAGTLRWKAKLRS
jgi:hypothetical protein